MQSGRPVLAADVGGTTTRVALVEWEGDRARIARRRRWASRGSASLGEALRAFLLETGNRPSAAGVAVAGPVRGGGSRLTNLPRELDAAKLERDLGVPVVLLNDLEAVAWAVELLPEAAFSTLLSGRPAAEGNLAVVGVGTGLGVAGLAWDGGRYVPFATEGGHAAYAPADAAEWELVQELAVRHGRVSRERVVSGQGLVELARLEARLAGKPGVRVPTGTDPAAAVTRAAEAGDPVAVAAVQRFVRALGRVAGDVALELGAGAGVVLAGGVAVRLHRWLDDLAFREAFLDKGRMRAYVEEIPVRLLREEGAGLLGAARRARCAAAAGTGGGKEPGWRRCS